MKKILVLLTLVMLNITLINAATPSETIKDSSGKTYHYYATTNYVIYTNLGHSGSWNTYIPKTFQLHIYYAQLGNRMFIKGVFTNSSRNGSFIYTVNENPRYGYDYFDSNFMYMIKGVDLDGSPSSYSTIYFNL